VIIPSSSANNTHSEENGRDRELRRSSKLIMWNIWRAFWFQFE